MNVIKEWILRYFGLLSKKQVYLGLLKDIDSNTNPRNTQINLCRLWDLIDPLLLDYLSVRERMEIKLTINYSSIGDLILSLKNINDIISTNQVNLVEYLKGIRLESNTLTLDDFLTDCLGYDYSLISSLSSLKEEMWKHSIVLDSHSDNYYQMIMNQVYQDLITFSKVLINNMRDTDKIMS